MSEYHNPVLLKESVDALVVNPDGIYADATFGGGGHSREIMGRLSPSGRLIAFDRDEDALANAIEDERFTLIHNNFRFIHNYALLHAEEGFDGIIADLGVSSHQFDCAPRGFSFRYTAPLDMRMDNTSPLSAWNVVNKWSEAEIAKILWEYGEEKFSRRIASRIVEKREVKPIETTLELVDIIKSAMPGAALREKQHPAKRSFQAIRIAVNDELGAVRQMMEEAPDKLNKGGRLCVISFHSLEDRIVKNGIASRENGCTCPREAPICVCGFVQTLKSVQRKPIVPGEEELEFNPRSRSAKLRVAERV